MIYVVTRNPSEPLSVVQFLNRQKHTAMVRVDAIIYEVEVSQEQQPHEIEALMAKMVAKKADKT